MTRKAHADELAQAGLAAMLAAVAVYTADLIRKKNKGEK